MYLYSSMAIYGDTCDTCLQRLVSWYVQWNPLPFTVDLVLLCGALCPVSCPKRWRYFFLWPGTLRSLARWPTRRRSVPDGAHDHQLCLHEVHSGRRVRRRWIDGYLRHLGHRHGLYVREQPRDGCALPIFCHGRTVPALGARQTYLTDSCSQCSHTRRSTLFFKRDFWLAAY